MPRIRITTGDVTQTATLNGTKTAQLVWDALPFTISGNRWGDEIYFSMATRKSSTSSKPAPG